MTQTTLLYYNINVHTHIAVSMLTQCPPPTFCIVDASNSALKFESSQLKKKMDRAADDSDLTNLNWVSGAEAPMNYSLSPPSSSRDNYLLQKQNQIAIECKKRGLCPYVDSYGNKRPTCSYSCLTALALKAATITDSGACLPVQEIYSCIE